MHCSSVFWLFQCFNLIVSTFWEMHADEKFRRSHNQCRSRLNFYRMLRYVSKSAVAKRLITVKRNLGSSVLNLVVFSYGRNFNTTKMKRRNEARNKGVIRDLCANIHSRFRVWSFTFRNTEACYCWEYEFERCLRNWVRFKVDFCWFAKI